MFWEILKMLGEAAIFILGMSLLLALIQTKFESFIKKIVKSAIKESKD